MSDEIEVFCTNHYCKWKHRSLRVQVERIKRRVLVVPRFFCIECGDEMHVPKRVEA